MFKKEPHNKKYRVPGKNRKLNKYNTHLCDNKMTFADCELTILRHAVDKTEELQGEKMVNSPNIKKMIEILEDFLIRKKLICYGGTAINAILPNYAKFYNMKLEIPDYDFFSKNALEDAKELADIYYNNGYTEVEAKAGMHHNTFKVFVNYIGIADITYLDPIIYDSIQKDAISIAGIHYAPPNFLRMSMYLELSRPQGDVTRWEKILKRLTLLNKYYPIHTNDLCNETDFLRKMHNKSTDAETIYNHVRDSFIEQGVVFFGGYAASIYSHYMPEKDKQIVEKIPDFDVIHTNPERCVNIVIEKLRGMGFKNVDIIVHDSIGELIPRHIELLIGDDTIAFLYEPIACHNYNKISLGNKEINIATIDTIMSFYLAFIYANKTYFSTTRILCMAKFLFEVQLKNRLEQKGILKRFSVECYGKQPILEEIRAEKSEKFKELKPGTKEYESWFLKYIPNKPTKIRKQSYKNKTKKNGQQMKSKEPVYNKSVKLLKILNKYKAEK